MPAFAPPVPRADRTVLIVSLILGVSLLLFCAVGMTGLGVSIYTAYQTLQKGTVQAVDRYLGELRDGQYTAAYTRLCAQDQALHSPADFASAEQEAGPITQYQVDTQIRAGQGGAVVVTATVARGSYPPRTEDYPVVFDTSNTPRVCPA